MLVAVFMLVLDVSVVTVSLPALRADLGASFESSQWVLDAYAIALATLLLPAASFADLRGRKRTYLAGLGLFTLSSLACALAPSIVALSVARGVQGLGGATLLATALPLIGAAFPEPAERAGAIAAFGATLAIGIAVGPLVGGALTEALGWQAIFLVNVPVGLVTWVAASRRLAESADPAGRRLDILGVGLLGAGLLALVFATVRGNVEGWGSAPIVGGFAAAAVLLGAFLAVERRRRDPMLELALFGSVSFSAAGVAVVALGGLIGTLVPLAAMLEQGLGHTALQAGAEVLPVSFACLLSAAVTGQKLSPRVAPRLLLAAGLWLVAAGLDLMTLVRYGRGFPALLPGMALAGLGWGAVNVVATELALAAVEPARAGMATGTLNVLRQIGMAAGIAALGAVYESATGGGLPAAAASSALAGAIIAAVGAVAVLALAGAATLVPEAARAS